MSVANKVNKQDLHVSSEWFKFFLLIQEVSKGSWKKHGPVGKWSVQVQDHRTVEGSSEALIQGFCFLSLSVSYQYCSTSLWFQAISQYLPRGDLRLRPAIYEMILHEFLKTDYEVLCPTPVSLASCDKIPCWLMVCPICAVHEGFRHTDPWMARRALQQHGYCSSSQRPPEEGPNQQNFAHHTGWTVSDLDTGIT